MEKKINVCIVHYNTPFMTECLVKSINKFTPGCNIYIFDNSDEKPFIAKFDNVKIIDNTQGQIIDFDKWLTNYPNRFKSGGRQNNYGSAKHCYSIEKCIEIINDDFILMDSDILIKKDFSDIIDESYFVCGCVENQKFFNKRIAPYLCYFNVNKIKQNGIVYFNDKKMHGLNVTESGDKYDTGAWIYEEIYNSEKLKEININQYFIHYKGGSWYKKHNNRASVIKTISNRPIDMLPYEWALYHSNLWNDEKIIVTMTSWHGRIKNIPFVLDSIYNQTLKPSNIIINLSQVDFPNKEESIDDEVIKYITLHENISINWIPGINTKHWKKIIPVLQMFPNDVIINIDDDKIYKDTMIETLFLSYLENPNNPISGGNYVFKGLQCHTGPCSLIKSKFYEGYEEYLLDGEIFKLHSSDIFFTYLANKNGYNYIYCGYNFENDAKIYNEYMPMNKEYTAHSKLDIMWNYLINKHGELPPEAFEINRHKQTNIDKHFTKKAKNRLNNVKKNTITRKKEVKPYRPTKTRMTMHGAQQIFRT